MLDLTAYIYEPGVESFELDEEAELLREMDASEREVEFVLHELEDELDAAEGDELDDQFEGLCCPTCGDASCDVPCVGAGFEDRSFDVMRDIDPDDGYCVCGYPGCDECFPGNGHCDCGSEACERCFAVMMDIMAADRVKAEQQQFMEFIEGMCGAVRIFSDGLVTAGAVWVGGIDSLSGIEENLRAYAQVVSWFMELDGLTGSCRVLIEDSETRMSLEDYLSIPGRWDIWLPKVRQLEADVLRDLRAMFAGVITGETMPGELPGQIGRLANVLRTWCEGFDVMIDSRDIRCQLLDGDGVVVRSH